MSPRRSPAAVLDDFLPPVRRWFSRTFAAPSPAQAKAWPVIRQGHSVLLLAPTGSGKTLAAFLGAIDELLRRAREDTLGQGVQVLYVTPLKALGNDIQKNLLVPLAGIRREARGHLPELRIAVRSGDTPQSERQAMVRRPPHILITTPESLYLMLGSRRLAPALESIRTVIVDEVHALCGNKRGVHLSLSLERLQAHVGRPLQRIGCSATISPLEEVARFLVGRDDDGQPRPCRVLDAGRRKRMDVLVDTPLPDFLEATNTALWNAAYERLREETGRHRTTLIFCNSRYKAERTWLRLRELAGEGESRIGVHHGSMSRETRLEAEDALKSGKLEALVATGTLELGIDIGSVDLVYQLESPKSVATGLQRIGRAGHLLDATSKGRVLTFDRDELFEAAAVCRAMTEGEIDAVQVPRGCLDVLAQQIAGALASGDWQADELFALARRADPYAELTREEFEAVVAMLAGEPEFRLKDAPPILALWDRASGRLSPARSTGHITAMCVGTIAETSEYDVVIARTGKRIGRVQSEFVDDCLRIDDVFALGNSAWRVTGKQRNRLLVAEAPAATPTVPWWQGPAEQRTPEVGIRVGWLRRTIAERLDDGALPGDLQRQYRVSASAASAMIEYVREQRLAVGHVPDHERLLVETWTDELGRANLILHCPLGQRLNDTWAQTLVVAARERLGQKWSSTTSNDLVVLSLRDESGGRPRPFDAAELLGLVRAPDLESLARQSAESSVGEGAVFRNAAVCALQIPRGYKGRRVPVWLQNFRAEELGEAARSHADYPVFREVRRLLLHDQMDVAGLHGLLERIEAGAVTLTFVEVKVPSPFVHALLVRDLYRDDHQMGRDRRAHLLRLHRQVLQEVLSAEELAQLLDVRAIDRLERRLLHESETTRARSSDELAQAIHELGDLPATIEAVERIVTDDPAGKLAPLLRDHRVVAVNLPDCEQNPLRLVSADRWRQYYDAIRPPRTGGRAEVHLPVLEEGRLTRVETASAAAVIPARWRRPTPPAEARRAIAERYLRRRGPVTAYELANHTGFPVGQLQHLLDELVAEGSVAQGVYRGDKPRPQWVERTNLTEIHRQTMGLLKRELAACSPPEVVDFTVRWQHLHPATRLSGLDGLRQVIAQLQGYEIIQGVLEPEVLAGRVADYQPEMLDRLFSSGEVTWRRLHPSRIHRVMLTFCLRRDLPWLAAGQSVELDGAASADVDIRDSIIAVRDHLRQARTAFFDDVVRETGLEADVVERAVWHLAWCGELTCDTFEGLRRADFRATVSACYDLATTPRNIVHWEYGTLGWNMTTRKVVDRLRQRGLDPRLGRWSVTERLVADSGPPPREEVVRSWAQQLLARWGVLTRQILDTEVAAPSWADLLPELKRLELLGRVQRGYFIEPHPGEQYGLPEAIELLRECRGRRPEGSPLGYLPDEPLIVLSSRDPANLYTSSLEILRQDGELFPRSQKGGNTCWRYIVQAGQVLIHESRQLVALEREPLRRCFEALRRDPMGREQRVAFDNWNGYPIAVSPVTPVLLEAGYALNGRGQLQYPPGRGKRTASRGQGTAESRPGDQTV
ncbi:MAG: DEAD/DEAH box helicase, partial [Candidatus Latescibacterota bacterium]